MPVKLAKPASLVSLCNYETYGKLTTNSSLKKTYIYVDLHIHNYNLVSFAPAKKSTKPLDSKFYPIASLPL